MTEYKILKPENIHDSLKGKPRWMICVVFAAGLLIMTLSAVAAGAFIGYTYCYVEYRTGVRTTGNMSQAQNLRIMNAPPVDQEAKEQNTINGAIMSSQFMQKILKIGHSLMDDNHDNLPAPYDERHIEKLEREI